MADHFQYCNESWAEEEDGRLISGVYYPPIGIDGYYTPDENVRRIFDSLTPRAVVGHCLPVVSCLDSGAV
jgi:hypothetical protein